ncbi:MAG: hypothetical protein ACYC2U_01265 [Candidatus Amoebophilus sp.]
MAEEPFTAQGGHTVTFYNYKGQIYASVEIVDEKSKVFNGVPVRIEEGANIIGLLKIPKHIQKNRICVQFVENSEPVKVFIHKGVGLLGGMKEGDEDGKEEKTRRRRKETEYKKAVRIKCSTTNSR